jgi:hypothetical protein
MVMGAFDFLGTDDQVDTDSKTTGGIMSLFSNPNFIRFLGQAGAGMSPKGSVGYGIGNAVDQTERSMQLQKAMSGQINGLQPPKVTPKGQAGPDSITTKQTADGTTQTIQTPSEAKLSSFGMTTPPESKSTAAISGATVAGGGSDHTPFWKALLQ